MKREMALVLCMIALALWPTALCAEEVEFEETEVTTETTYTGSSPYSGGSS